MSSRIEDRPRIHPQLQKATINQQATPNFFTIQDPHTFLGRHVPSLPVTNLTLQLHWMPSGENLVGTRPVQLLDFRLEQGYLEQFRSRKKAITPL